MPTASRPYHGAEPPGDPEDGASEAFEPTAWASIASDMVGTVIDGRYRVEALLGAGAMAFVLAGQHVHLGKRVALKVLHPELAELGELRARFQREARAASRVAHPAVIEVTDFGVSEDGLYYLVMEHLSGRDLHRWVSERGRLAPDVVAGIGRQLAEALEAIHQAGFVHRDIKPENIFVLDGEPPAPMVPPVPSAPTIKVLDLGIAAVSAQRPNKDDPRLTRAGQTLGTVSFMAPEQVAARPLDGRVDIYATGCVLFELLTGHLPFEAETPTEIMMAHLREPAPDVRSLRPGVPDWLADVIARCLAKKPEDRYPDALALAKALEPGRVATVEAPVDPTGDEAIETSSLDAPRKKRRWLVVAFGAGLAVTVASAVLLGGQEPGATGSLPAEVPMASGVAPATTKTTPEAQTGPTAPSMEDTTTEADTSSSTVADALEPGTMAPDAIAVQDFSTADATPEAGPDAKEHDTDVKIQAPRPASRPKVTPRDRTRSEPEPSSPKADTPKTPSGLWRPRPPSGGDD